MTRTIVLTAVTLTVVAPNSFAQVSGYITYHIQTGDNLFVDQLDNSTNTLDSIFNPVNAGSDTFPAGLNPPIPNGATFTMWNSTNNSFLPLSVYNSTNHTWSINYTWQLGEGAVLHSPSSWSDTLMGQVDPSVFDRSTGFEIWQPNYAPGLYLIGAPVPFAGSLEFMFTNVVGRLPEAGDSVRFLDPATQDYTIATFNGVTGWDNDTSSLQVGEAAWFTLVPEPSFLSILGIGSFMAAWRMVFRPRHY